MTFAAEADVQALTTPSFAISVTSNPTSIQVGLFIVAIDAEIQGALTSQGYTLDTTEEPATSELKRLNAMGAAAQTLMSAFPQDSGPASNGLAQNLWKAYNDRLNQIRKGIGIPSGLSKPSEGAEAGALVNYFTLYNAVAEDSDAEDAWGAPIDSAPAFTRGQVF